MSHTIRKTNLANTALAEITILDYATGGETFTLAELGLSGSVVSVLFLGAIGNMLNPILSGNKVVLEVRPGIEQPATVGLNYTFVAIVHGT